MVLLPTTDWEIFTMNLYTDWEIFTMNLYKDLCKTSSLFAIPYYKEVSSFCSTCREAQIPVVMIAKANFYPMFVCFLCFTTKTRFALSKPVFFISVEEKYFMEYF